MTGRSLNKSPCAIRNFLLTSNTAMNDIPISPIPDIVNDFHLETLLRSAISAITGEIAQFSPAEIEKRITLKAGSDRACPPTPRSS
jgi:hypothetical protein